LSGGSPSVYASGGNGSAGAITLDFSGTGQSGTLTAYDGGGGVISAQSFTSSSVLVLPSNGAYFIVT
jgi:hypothetical protein